MCGEGDTIQQHGVGYYQKHPLFVLKYLTENSPSVFLLKCNSKPTFHKYLILSMIFLIGWKDVKVAAVNCAEDENIDICRHYDIMAYPSLKMFPPDAKKNDTGVE